MGIGETTVKHHAAQCEAGAFPQLSSNCSLRQNHNSEFLSEMGREGYLEERKDMLQQDLEEVKGEEDEENG